MGAMTNAAYLSLFRYIIPVFVIARYEALILPGAKLVPRYRSQ